MSRVSIGFGLALLIATGSTVAGCSRASTTSEGQVRPQSTPDPEDKQPTVGDTPMPNAAPPTARSTGIDILGIRLGAAYSDALTQAGAMFMLDEDGPEDHTGKGTIVGVPATITLAGKGGRLVDIQIQATLAQADQGLQSSALFTRLQTDLGAPAELAADLARWEPAGFEVTLQRRVVHAKGERTPRTGYTLRARATPVPNGAAPDPDEAEIKRREAEGAR